MKPISILLSINLAFLAIWGLLFGLGINRPEYIPLMTSFQAALNVLGAGVFFLDKRKHIAVAFLVGAGICIAVTGVGYWALNKYGKNIRIEEQVTS
jgi:hypothetical protein